MNYKTTLVLTAIAAAALVASAFPMVGTVFAQNNANTCTGSFTTGAFGLSSPDCRQQGVQQGNNNNQSNAFN